MSTITNSPVNEHRTLVIKNYRNFAPFCEGKDTDSNDDKEFLTINRGLDRDEIGGLVTLISVNNCGKSNLLRALEIYGGKVEIEEGDYTDFNYFSDIRPSISMNVANGAYGDFVKKVTKISWTGDLRVVTLALMMDKDGFDEYRKWCAERDRSNKLHVGLITVEDYVKFLFGIFFYPEESEYAYQLRAANKINDPFIDRVVKVNGWESVLKRMSTSQEILVNTLQAMDYYYLPQSFLTEDPSKQLEMDGKHFSENDPNPKIATICRTLNQKLKTSFSTENEYDSTGSGLFSGKYDYQLSNGVYRYAVEKVKQEDFICSYDERSTFIDNLLDVLGCDEECIKKIHENKKNFRIGKQKEMKKRLEFLSNELNDLLNINDKKYALGIDFQEEHIVFSITSGDDIPVNIDRQSEGFTWLFNMYFGLIKHNNLEPGDMVLIDEFGNSLNFATIRELTKKLRSFAQRLGITIVLATQNPMAIDINHLDEVRLLVPRPDGSTHIINNFNQFGEDNNHDVLAPVLNGLTISRNFMRSDNRKTVFVEGVTDYFYLNGVCEALRKNGATIDIDFIPINGVGCRSDDPKGIISQILSIESNPMVLTDGDYAGKTFKNCASSEKITVCNISDILQRRDKKVIEDLFTQADAEKIGIRTPGSPEVNKKFNHAARLSYKIPNIYNEFEEETRLNFETIVNYLKSL